MSANACTATPVFSTQSSSSGLDAGRSGVRSTERVPYFK